MSVGHEFADSSCLLSLSGRKEIKRERKTERKRERTSEGERERREPKRQPSPKQIIEKEGGGRVRVSKRERERERERERGRWGARDGEREMGRSALYWCFIGIGITVIHGKVGIAEETTTGEWILF